MSSTQQQMAQPSQRVMNDGLPEGYPPTREHLHDCDPLTTDLQKRLDDIAKQNLGECPPGSVARDYLLPS